MSYKNLGRLLLLSIGVFFIFKSGFSQVIQKKDTLYFDENWKPSTHDNYEFYRPLPLKKIGKLSLLIDFYKNGNMQMQGYVYTANEKKFAGDVYWYKKDGSDTSRSKYINTTNKPLTYYHHNGTIWKTNTYNKGVKIDTIKLYNDKGKKRGVETYENGVRVNDTIDKFANPYYSVYKNEQIAFNKNVKKVFRPTKALYWMNSGKLASVTDYKDTYTMTGKKIYNTSGKLVKQYRKNDFIANKLADGNYYNVKTVNGFAVSIDSTSQVSQQSQVIRIDDVSFVNADKTDGYLEFYKKTASDTYAEFDFDLLYENTNNGIYSSFTSYGYDMSGNTSYNDLYDKNYHTIAVDDIKTQSITQLFESLKLVEWGSLYKESNNYNNDTINHRLTSKLLNSHVFLNLDEAFTTKENGGFGSFYQEEDDDVKKWRISNSNFYTVRVFLLNDNKPILVLSNENDIEYYIIPTKANKFIVNFVDENDTNLVQQPHSKFSSQSLKKILARNNSANFYGKHTENERQYVTNIFNEIIIEKAYDSIQLANKYIIGRTQKKIDIYNLKLEKLPLYNIREAYYDRDNLQILENNQIKYVDVLGKETKRQKIYYSFCGTVSSTKFSLIKTKEKNYAIEIRRGGFTSSYTSMKILNLENLDTENDITFLNKKTSDGYDGNSGFVDGYVNRTNLLVVKKNEKVGLYAYDHDVKFKRKNKPKTKKNTNGVEPPVAVLDINETTYGTTVAKELLPVIYDKIELKEPLIIVKKQGKQGIYPLKNGLKYKHLGNVIANFISYETINGEKGWIDVKTLKEYPNK